MKVCNIRNGTAIKKRKKSCKSYICQMSFQFDCSAYLFLLSVLIKSKIYVTIYLWNDGSNCRTLYSFLKLYQLFFSSLVRDAFTILSISIIYTSGYSNVVVHEIKSDFISFIVCILCEGIQCIFWFFCLFVSFCFPRLLL